MFNGKRFTTVLWGYERAQVDEFLEECQNWAGGLTSDLERAETQLGESAAHVRALEAKVAKLEQRTGDAAPESVRSFADRLDEVVGDAWEAGRMLRSRSESEAEAAQERAHQTASELVDAAKQAANEIGAEAQRDRREAARALQAAQEQADRMLKEGQATATERACRVWDEAQDRVRDTKLELERLEEQRRATLEELAGLRSSLEGLVGAA